MIKASYLFREICMLYYERLHGSVGQSAPLLVRSRVRIPLSLLIFLAKITRPLMRKNSNIYFIGGFCYERENQKVYGCAINYQKGT